MKMLLDNPNKRPLLDVGQQCYTFFQIWGAFFEVEGRPQRWPSHSGDLTCLIGSPLGSVWAYSGCHNTSLTHLAGVCGLFASGKTTLVSHCLIKSSGIKWQILFLPMSKINRGLSMQNKQKYLSWMQINRVMEFNGLKSSFMRLTFNFRINVGHYV